MPKSAAAVAVRYTVLACACLSDDTGLSHLLREKHLTEHVVDLVGTGMV